MSTSPAMATSSSPAAASNAGAAILLPERSVSKWDCGVCGTCHARLTEGEVSMARNYALEPAEVAAGFILTCQSRPVTAAVTVSFDT